MSDEDAVLDALDGRVWTSTVDVHREALPEQRRREVRALLAELEAAERIERADWRDVDGRHHCPHWRLAGGG